jgi:hypothetical protein
MTLNSVAYQSSLPWLSCWRPVPSARSRRTCVCGRSSSPRAGTNRIAGRLLILLGVGGQSTPEDAVWFDDVELYRVTYFAPSKIASDFA